MEKVIEKQKLTNQQCHFSEDYEYIMDSDGNQVFLDDPRIAHVLPEARDTYGSRLVLDLYKNHNINLRIAPRTDASIIQYGRKACSGRECLATVALVGAVVKDISEDRSEDEITIYRAPIDQHGPCQNGGWPVLWDSISRRLNAKNTINYIAPNYKNKFLGLPREIIAQESIFFLIGNYLQEARNSLYCIAEDKDSAMESFENITDEFIEAMKEGKYLPRVGLIKWAREISKIPRKTTIQQAPKIIVIGGLNLMFDYYPIEQFFLSKEVVPKIVDFMETISLILSEPSLRFGFKKGLIHPEQQLNVDLINEMELSDDEIKEAEKAKRSLAKISIIETQIKSFRKAMKKAGLLFDSGTEFKDILVKGHEFMTLNSCTETTVIIGRYLDSIQNTEYDGVVNLGSFNCQPAMNSQAIIRPLANRSEIPYAAVDCEGPWLTSNQQRLLETIAIQAIRLRNEKNKASL